MFKNVPDFLRTMLRLLVVAAVVIGIALAVSISKGAANELKPSSSSYALAFPKPVGKPQKAKPIKFVWVIAAIYRSEVDKPDFCRPGKPDVNGRISVLRNIQNPADTNEYAVAGVDVMSEEAALEACATTVIPAQLKWERKYAHE